MGRIPSYETSRGTEYWAPSRPGETGLARALRLHFQLTVVALLAWAIAVLVLLAAGSDVFPRRWDLYSTFTEPPHHRYLYGRALLVLLFEGLAAGLYYRRGGPEARLVAGLMGASVLLGVVFVDLMLMSVRMPADTVSLVLLTWIAVGHLAYALLWRGRRA